MFGLLNLRKPQGWSSREAVDRVARLVRPAKVGHAGTLDPLAEGVLVLCLGPATRLIEYVQQMPKRYDARFRLGCRSPSDDLETEVEELGSPLRPSAEACQAAFPLCPTTLAQRPPAYSAIKQQGRRAYKLARRGETVELPPRDVELFAVSLLSYDYPELTVRLDCGSGFYVRSFGRDLAESLGTAAVMTGLVRSAIGPFRIEEALEPTKLTCEMIERSLLPPLAAVPQLPTVSLTDDQAAAVRAGKLLAGDELGIACREAAALSPPADSLRSCNEPTRGRTAPPPTFFDRRGRYARPLDLPISIATGTPQRRPRATLRKQL